jgi:hypothetical protein
MEYVEIDADGAARHLHYAPYLDYRPLSADEPGVDALSPGPSARGSPRAGAVGARHAVKQVVPSHVAEVRGQRWT